MNAQSTIQTAAARAYGVTPPQERAVADHLSRLAVKADICRRADKIANRLIPRLDTPHGFYQPTDFMASVRRNAIRTSLQKAIIARMMERLAA